ncbi:hypothetical protein O9993_22700 [Vibrio lentus]|nr:hypothetical protein [Vibrio lentus]
MWSSKVKVFWRKTAGYSKGSEIKDGYPEFSDKLLKQLGWCGT